LFTREDLNATRKTPKKERLKQAACHASLRHTYLLSIRVRVRDVKAIEVIPMTGVATSYSKSKLAGAAISQAPEEKL
jgi:hypothetical protein